jgi:hypothetical protein
MPTVGSFTTVLPLYSFLPFSFVRLSSSLSLSLPLSFLDHNTKFKNFRKHKSENNAEFLPQNAGYKDEQLISKGLPIHGVHPCLQTPWTTLLHTEVAFNGIQLQTAVADSGSRDLQHNEVITCGLLLLLLLPRLSLHFLVLHCWQLKLFDHAATQKPWTSTTNSAHSCAYSAPKYVGQLEATVQKQTVRDRQ